MAKRLQYKPGDIVNTSYGYGVILFMKLYEVNILMLNNCIPYYIGYDKIRQTIGETDINLLNHILDIK